MRAFAGSSHPFAHNDSAAEPAPPQPPPPLPPSPLPSTTPLPQPPPPAAFTVPPVFEAFHMQAHEIELMNMQEIAKLSLTVARLNSTVHQDERRVEVMVEEHEEEQRHAHNAVEEVDALVKAHREQQRVAHNTIEKVGAASIRCVHLAAHTPPRGSRVPCTLASWSAFVVTLLPASCAAQSFPERCARPGGGTRTRRADAAKRCFRGPQAQK